MTPEEKKNKMKENIQIFLDSYLHLYNARKTNYNNKVNFLLVSVSFLPILCITLYTIEKNPLFLIPAIIQGAALLVLLKSFFIKEDVLWLELKEDILKKLEGDIFHQDLLAALKASEERTRKEMNETLNIIRITACLIIASLYILTLIAMFIVLKNDTISLFLSGISTTGTFCILVRYYQKHTDLGFDQDYIKFKKDIDDWINKE